MSILTEIKETWNSIDRPDDEPMPFEWCDEEPTPFRWRDLPLLILAAVVVLALLPFMLAWDALKPNRKEPRS